MTFLTIFFDFSEGCIAKPFIDEILLTRTQIRIMNKAHLLFPQTACCIYQDFPIVLEVFFNLKFLNV